MKLEPLIWQSPEFSREIVMYAGQLFFSQVMAFAPWHTFRCLVRNVRSFSCLDQFLCMAIAQLTRDTVRERSLASTLDQHGGYGRDKPGKRTTDAILILMKKGGKQRGVSQIPKISTRIAFIGNTSIGRDTGENSQFFREFSLGQRKLPGMV